MYGAKYVGNIDGGTVAMTRKFKIKISEVIAKGDILTIDTTGTTGGKVTIAAANVPILGIANETVTGNATGSNTVEVILALPGSLWLIDNDNTAETFAQDDVGEWHDLAGSTTGAQLIDTNVDDSVPSGTAQQFVCVEYNPQGHGMDSDTSIGMYVPTYTYFGSNYTA